MEIYNNSHEVSQAARKRASKLSDPRNGYVYSTIERIIHDRTCKRVSRISDDCFEMSKKLIPGMPMCNLCRRKAWIRLGMGDDTKYIDAYDRFFREAYVVFSSGKIESFFLDMLVIYGPVLSNLMPFHDKSIHVSILCLVLKSLNANGFVGRSQVSLSMVSNLFKRSKFSF